MKRLAVRLEQLDVEVHRSAVLGCRLIDQLRRGLTPAALDDFQHGLRMGLLDVESRIREWRARQPRRAVKLKALRRRSGGGSPTIGAHLELCQRMEAQLEQLRRVLRQLGDALAWLVLREDVRVLAPLYAQRTHFLNPGAGLAGPTELIMRAHRTGQFLVLDNDLTRCLGQGDITVVPVDGRWWMPLALECKTSASDEPLAEGSLVTTLLTSAVHEDALHAGLHARFADALGLLNGRPPGGAAPAEEPPPESDTASPTDSDAAPAAASRQEAEMLGRVRILAETLVERPEIVGTSRQQWDVVRRVLRRALATGWAADVAERGLVIGAASTPPDRAETEKHLAAVKAAAKDCGCPALLNSTANLAMQDALSGLVPPVALWPLTADERGAVLSGQVVVTVHQAPDLWERAFADRGFALATEEGEWVLWRGTLPPARFDQLQVLALRSAVGSGVSPASVALSLAEAMNAADADTP